MNLVYGFSLRDWILLLMRLGLFTFPWLAPAMGPQ